MAHQVWSEEEISDAVNAYLEMQQKDISCTPYVKNEYYKSLSAKHGRTPKAYGRRMSNISYVFTLMDLPIVSGLSPLSNVGVNHAQLIERLVSERMNKPFLDVSQFEIDAIKIVESKKEPSKPEGDENPGYAETTTKVYKRSGKVKGWVLRRAKGHCELCKQEAPFKKADGEPFLEVHHLIRLKDGGPDTVENCVALCPNCHRYLHYADGKDTMQRISSLAEKLG
jgi:5-methylcytosine-specific restriction enzyme A